MKEIILPAVKRLRTGSQSQICFELPVKYRDLVWHMITQANNRKIEYFRLRIATPRKARSTGEKSQNHHLNGHCQQIAVETGNNFDTVKLAVKELAISMGLPFEEFRGKKYAMSEADMSVEECILAIEASHMLAADLGIILIEEEE